MSDDSLEESEPTESINVMESQYSDTLSSSKISEERTDSHPQETTPIPGEIEILRKERTEVSLVKLLRLTKRLKDVSTQ